MAPKSVSPLCVSGLKGVSKGMSQLTALLLEIVADSAFGCVSTCEAVRILVRRSPPSLRGVPVARLRKRVCDTLTRNPLFRPAGKEFNHGIRRRYGLAPTQKEKSTNKCQTTADFSVSTASRRTENILTEILGSPPSSPVFSDCRYLQSVHVVATPVVVSSSFLRGSGPQFQSMAPPLPFPPTPPSSPVVLPCLTADDVSLLLC